MKRKILITLLVILFLLTNSIAILATNLTEVQNKIDKTEEEIGEVKSNLSDVMKQVRNLTSQISNYETEISKLADEMKTLEEEINQAQINLEEEETKYLRQQDMLEKRIVALYEAGETNYLDVILSSTSISEFISNYYLVSEIATYDTELLEEIENRKIEIEKVKKDLEDKRVEIEEIKIKQEEKLKLIESAKNEKTTYAAQLTQEEKGLQNQLEQFEADKREIQRKLSEIAGNDTNTKTIISGTPSSSGYIFPVAGCTKSNINNLSYPSYAGHTGIDVNINVTGKSVVAVKSGTVVISTALRNSNGNYRSYGEYIVINHHDGTMTLYAHMLANSRTVSVGEEVVQGQKIGIVGSTGNSTGTHLHFEVRVGGYCVNPIPYLP